MTVAEVDDGFELITPTEEEEATQTQQPKKVRKLCACGCGEEVTGNRALIRGHTMGTGLAGNIWGADDIFVLQSAFIGMFLYGTRWVEHKTKFKRMEPEEAQAIAPPAARIFARHFPKRLLKYMKPGDVSDAMAIMTVFTAYTLRASMESEKKEETSVYATNGHDNDSGVSRQGLDTLSQYTYRPPEQTF